jgi:DNA repair protein RAD57
MADLFASYPQTEIDLDEYNGLLRAFELSKITTSDLMVMDHTEIAQACSRSATEIRPFLALLYKDIEKSLVLTTASEYNDQGRTGAITTGDAKIDELLGGGVRTGCLTEVTGESATGKSHFLTQLTVTVQLPVNLGGLNKSAIYISTESSLETNRLLAICNSFNTMYPDAKCSGDRIHYYKCQNQEELEHVLKYQLPIAIKTFDTGLIVIDSITAHYRAEMNSNKEDIVQRDHSLIRLSSSLRQLAQQSLGMNIGIVVANQVSDRFEVVLGIDHERDPLLLDHQLRWFSGWTDISISTRQRNNPEPTSSPLVGSNIPSSPPLSSGNMRSSLPSSMNGPTSSPIPYTLFKKFLGLKQPSLGMTWANCVDQRIVLKRGLDEYGSLTRLMEVVFSPYCPANSLTFEIIEDGIRSCT